MIDDEWFKSARPTCDRERRRHASGPLVGILDYNFGNFRSSEVAARAARAALAREVTHTAAAPTSLGRDVQRREPRPATSPRRSSTRWRGLIVNNLRAPDIVALEEIQDNNGATGGTGSSSSTRT